MNRGNNKFNPFRNRGSFAQNMQQKQKPMFSVPSSSNSMNVDSPESTNSTEEPFVADYEPGSFIGWKIYFPTKCKIKGLKLISAKNFI